MLARIFVAVGGLFVLALLAALVGPYLIDWSAYRAEFEREASAVLGRKVTVRGTAGARILPFPSVTFTDVLVGAGAAAPAMTVETFSMDAELAPLLQGEFLIFDMRLLRPRVVVDVAADGTVDWAVRPSAPFDLGRIAVENLSIADGEVVLRHGESGREHRLTDIDARLAARSLAGPWTGGGTLDFDGRRVAVSGSTGIAASGGLRLRLEVVPDASALRIATDGTLAVIKGAAGYSGSFRASGATAGADASGRPPRSGEGDPLYSVAGNFALDHGGILVPAFRFETGSREEPFTADGKASLTFAAAPRFALEASGDQFRFPAQEATGSGSPLPDRLSRLEEVVRALPRPSIPGRVELDLPAVVAGDTTVRDLKLSAEPAENGWRILSLAASLPGRTTVEADGLLLADEGLGFDGSLLLAVGQPSGFAAWLGRDVDEAVRNLPAAGFSAKVQLRKERQSFSGLEVVLGAARLKGSAVNNLPAGGRPSLVLDLSGGSLDLDQADALATVLVGPDGLREGSRRDLDLVLRAGPLRAGSLAAETLDLAVKLGANGLSIERLLLKGLAGAAIEASGTFSGPDDARTGEMKASVAAADLRPLLAQAAGRFPGNAALAWLGRRAAAFPGLLADAKLNLTLGTRPSGSAGPQAALRASGSLGGTDLTLSVTSDTWLTDWGSGETKLDAKLRSDDGAALLALSGLPAAPLELTGPAELTLAAAGVPAAGLRAEATLAGERFSASFEGSATPTADGGLSFRGPVALEAVDIEPWMLTLAAGLPSFGLGTPADLRAAADYADGLLVLSGIKGSFDEKAVAGDVNIALRAGLPEITGALALDDFDLAAAASVLLGEGAFDEEADGRMVTPFRPRPPAPFGAGLSISAGTLSAGALGTLYDADFTLTLDARRLALGALTATYGGGRLKGAAELKNDGGTALLSGQFDLKGADTRTSLGNAASLSARGDFSGSVTAGGSSVEALVSGLNGSGTATLHGVVLEGIDAGALPALLARGDAAGPQIDASAVQGFAPAILSGGTLSAERADFAFTVTGGVVRTPPFSLSGPSAALSADLRADLGARTVSARGRLLLEPGADALVGSEPAVGLTLEGSLASPILHLDTAPLAQFLVQRRLEREQARIEELQASLLEKQRLRREVRYFAALGAARDSEAAGRERAARAAKDRIDERASASAAARAGAARQEEVLRRKVEAAIRLAERARTAAEPPARGGQATPEADPPVPQPRELDLDLLAPALGAAP